MSYYKWYYKCTLTLCTLTFVLTPQGLRILDPSGVVLEQVCDPVRRYLRTRDNTVRTIVASLIDDSEIADVSFL